MKADTKVQSNDTVVELVTTIVERDGIVKALGDKLITADRIVGWTYLDDRRIQVQVATGNLPETHGVAIKTAYNRQDKKPMLFNWDNLGDVNFFGVYNYDQIRLRIEHLIGDVNQLSAQLTFTNGRPAKFMDTVIPLKDIADLKQFAVIKGRGFVDMTAKGLTMVRVDRVNGLVTALQASSKGEVKRLVGLPVDQIKQNPDLLTQPEKWQVLVKTSVNMLFYGRVDYTDIFGKTSVHFTDRTARKLIVERDKDGQIKAKWDGNAVKINYFLVGQLAGNRDLLVGYDVNDDISAELFFTTRDDANLAYMV